MRSKLSRVNYNRIGWIVPRPMNFIDAGLWKTGLLGQSIVILLNPPMNQIVLRRQRSECMMGNGRRGSQMIYFAKDGVFLMTATSRLSNARRNRNSSSTTVFLEFSRSSDSFSILRFRMLFVSVYSEAVSHSMESCLWSSLGRSGDSQVTLGGISTLPASDSEKMRPWQKSG
jgi:hypothetical protein